MVDDLVHVCALKKAGGKEKARQSKREKKTRQYFCFLTMSTNNTNKERRKKVSNMK